MPTITYRWQGNGIARLHGAAEGLSGPRKIAAFRRGLNHTGDKTYTIVKRTLAKQMGLTQASLERRGLSRVKANNAALVYIIKGKGSHIPLKEFGARQGAKGVSAAPWGRRQMFRSTFIVASIGGNVFKRVGRKRLPIEKLWGPSLPREMVKAETAAAFEATVAANLAPRIEHEIRVLTNGVVS